MKSKLPSPEKFRALADALNDLADEIEACGDDWRKVEERVEARYLAEAEARRRVKKVKVPTPSIEVVDRERPS